VNNQFNKDEIVKVNNKDYPIVGGRLRLAHDENQKNLSIETTVIKYEDGISVIQAKVTTEKGVYNGLGNATVTRDARLKAAILELAETRAIARALRFAGYGVEYTGFEEVDYENQEQHESSIKDAQVKKLFSMANKKGYNAESVKKTAMKKYNVTEIAQLNKTQYNEMYKGYEGLQDK